MQLFELLIQELGPLHATDTNTGEGEHKAWKQGYALTNKKGSSVIAQVRGGRAAGAPEVGGIWVAAHAAPAVALDTATAVLSGGCSALERGSRARLPTENCCVPGAC